MRNEVILLFVLNFSILCTHSFIIKSQSVFNGLYANPNDVIKYTRKNPLKCKVESIRLIGRYDDSCEFYHIILSHQQPFRFCEGQYCTVIPPNDELSNARFAPRAYSITNRSCLVGENGVIEFCVRKFINPATNKPGICSSYLIESKIGDLIDVAGPFGRLNVLKILKGGDSSTIRDKSNLVVFATGTGIAPIRSFYKYLFNSDLNEPVDIFNKFLLVYGVKNEDCLLFNEELDGLESRFGDRFNILRVFSRTKQRKYVQDTIIDNPDYFKAFINEDSKIVICGTKGMVMPIKQSLEKITSKNMYEMLLNNMLIEVY